MMVLLLKVTLLLMAALVGIALLRRSSAAMRHLICVCALAGVLFLPLSLLAPAHVGAFHIDVSFASRVPPAAVSARWPLTTILLTVWACGSVLLLVRLLSGYIAISCVLRTAEHAEFGDHIFFADISVPVVAGLLRPVILLPGAAQWWTDSQRSAAVKHELEHVRRGDLWTMPLGHLACAVYWFHPLVWILAWRARHEQESACDDAVLSAGFEPACYAEALVAAARNITSTRLIGCHMLTRKTLKSRIARLFDGGLARIPSRAGLRGAALASFAAVALAGMLFAAQEQVYKMGPNITGPKVLSKVQPEYSEEARAEKLAGTVLLSMVVGTDGMAHDINVVKPLGSGLDEKAVEAVQKWHFQPGEKDGEPVAVRAQIEINFRLQ